jgi:hypothetical protein
VLKAQERNLSGDFVLIADNWAPIKDKKLTAQVRRPVHVVLCGVAGAVNTDYLELARATGGSVHTMETDLVRLAELNEGNTFELDGQRFTIKDGRIQRLGTATGVKAAR